MMAMRGPLAPMNVNQEVSAPAVTSKDLPVPSKIPTIKAEPADRDLLNACAKSECTMGALTGVYQKARYAGGAGAAALRACGYYLDPFGRIEYDAARGESAWAAVAAERTTVAALRQEIEALRAELEAERARNSRAAAELRVALEDERREHKKELQAANSSRSQAAAQAEAACVKQAKLGAEAARRQRRRRVSGSSSKVRRRYARCGAAVGAGLSDRLGSSRRRCPLWPSGRRSFAS